MCAALFVWNPSSSVRSVRSVRIQDHRNGMTFCTFSKSIYIRNKIFFFGYLVGRLVIFLILIYIYIYRMSKKHTQFECL
jgi:hypothetical protein